VISRNLQAIEWMDGNSIDIIMKTTDVKNPFSTPNEKDLHHYVFIEITGN
jgi:hypothetical protein